MSSRECGPLTRVEAPSAVSCGWKKNRITFSCKTYGNETSTTQRTNEGAALLFIRIIHIIESANYGDVQWKSAVSTQKLQPRAKLSGHVLHLQFNWQWNLGALGTLAKVSFAHQKATIDQSPASFGPNCFKHKESLADHHNAHATTTSRSRSSSTTYCLSARINSVDLSWTQFILNENVEIDSWWTAVCSEMSVDIWLASLISLASCCLRGFVSRAGKRFSLSKPCECQKCAGTMKQAIP